MKKRFESVMHIRSRTRRANFQDFEIFRLQNPRRVSTAWYWWIELHIRRYGSCSVRTDWAVHEHRQKLHLHDDFSRCKATFPGIGEASSFFNTMGSAAFEMTGEGGKGGNHEHCQKLLIYVTFDGVKFLCLVRCSAFKRWSDSAETLARYNLSPRKIKTIASSSIGSTPGHLLVYDCVCVNYHNRRSLNARYQLIEKNFNICAEL